MRWDFGGGVSGAGLIYSFIHLFVYLFIYLLSCGSESVDCHEACSNYRETIFPGTFGESYFNLTAVDTHHVY